MQHIEYAIVFVPEPTATTLEPFHTPAFPCVEKIEIPNPVQFIPFNE